MVADDIVMRLYASFLADFLYLFSRAIIFISRVNTLYKIVLIAVKVEFTLDLMVLPLEKRVVFFLFFVLLRAMSRWQREKGLLCR